MEMKDVVCEWDSRAQVYNDVIALRSLDVDDPKTA